MSEYKDLLKTRLEVLKTDYVTMITNIDRVERELAEAKQSAAEMLGAIKNLELLKEQFNSVGEPKKKK